MSSPPAILLVFANDWVDDKRLLRGLYEESKAIVEALAPLAKAGAISLPPPIHNATVGDVLGAFRERSRPCRICVFHFGGHASNSTLMLEDETGARTLAHAGGLAGYLGRQRGLVLVFLNGCSTADQVRRLRAAGVKAVVATTTAIQDRVAAELAAAFYAELATRPLREAFETAEHAVRTRWGDDPRAVTRDVEPHEEKETPPSWPWLIDCDPAYERWTLASARGSGRSWWPRILVAASLSLTLLMLTSTGARRAACRVPGVRSLCAATGIGDVPAPGEQAKWDAARAQDECTGLEDYLGAYPDGIYAAQARSRLAGSWTRETLGLAEERRLKLDISSKLHASQEAAQRDALQRGDEEAAADCAPPAGSRLFELVSARAEPTEWSCQEEGPSRQFRCRLDGWKVCRVRSWLKTEHCGPRGAPAPHSR